MTGNIDHDERALLADNRVIAKLCFGRLGETLRLIYSKFRPGISITPQ